MQDHFLFDDTDPKQRNKGCDRMGDHSDGLKLKWHWSRYGTAKERTTPGQVCLAEVGDFRFEAIFWHTTFEARLQLIDEHLLSEGHDDNEGRS